MLANLFYGNMPALSDGRPNLTDGVKISFFIWIETIEKKGCINSYNYEFVTLERRLNLILTRDNNTIAHVSFTIRAMLSITGLII